MKKLTSILILILSSIVFTNCSCEYYLGKAEKMCGTITKTDTVKTTITTTLTAHDTLFKYTHHEQKDTLFIYKNNLVQKFFYNTKDSTVYMDGKCLPEIITVTVPYTYKELAYSVWKKYKFWFLSFFFLVALIIAIKIIKKVIK